jgi:hypothetical protein
MARSNAFVKLNGIPKCLASPLPEPMGIIPSGMELYNKDDATSLIVPSPPIAMIFFAPSLTACLVNCEAWFICSVIQTFELGIARRFATIRALLCGELVPELGLRIK